MNSNTKGILNGIIASTSYGMNPLFGLPLYTIGIKDIPAEENEKVKKHIAIEILLNLIIGASSDLYKKLYDKGNCYSNPSIEYEFDKKYAHILITGQSNNPEELYKDLKAQIKKYIQDGINETDFERTKKIGRKFQKNMMGNFEASEVLSRRWANKVLL